MDMEKDEQLEKMKSAEIIAEEVSPRISSSPLGNKGEELEEMKSVEITEEEVSPKPIVEIEEMIEEMDSVDIHEEEEEEDTQQDKLLRNAADSDDEDEDDDEDDDENDNHNDDDDEDDNHNDDDEDDNHNDDDDEDDNHNDDDDENDNHNDDDDDDSSSDSKDEDEIVKSDEEKTMSVKEESKPVDQSTSHDSQDPNSSAVITSAWTDKAAAIKNFVRLKSEVAVHTFIRRLSGNLNDDNCAQEIPNDGKDKREDESKPAESEGKSIWNPLSYLKMMQNDASVDRVEVNTMDAALEPVVMKGRIILYTRLGCEECRECRLYLHEKRLRYVEINIDIYPTRKVELEKICGSSSDVPKVFFNEELVGSLKELKELDETGEFEEKINHLIAEAPVKEAPLPPFSGEDDASSKGPVDELALIVRKMKPCIVKDRFYKMRRFKNCFLGSEAVDFLSVDQRLEREEAVEVARKLASQLFFQHVLDENLFEDGNHLYRFLDDDPVVSSQCHNIPRGIIELKPRPIVEIASRFTVLYRAILEAYTSPDGKHVDYRSIHGSEEFARYLRIIQELHRVELEYMKREEKLAFFINLYNMMSIHAILVWGHPSGPLERTKMFGDFKYVIGGNTYSLSSIQNGILRGNQRPPYNLMKPFGAKDKRSKVALPYAEPLSHFALVCGTRSGPRLRWFSPGEIDKELLEAARDFLRGGGLIVDLNSKVAYISKIFNWYGVDFGNSEEEVLKHASTFLEPQLSEALLDLLVDTQFRVVYQSYDWGLNN